jgi:hypothetical protein
MNGGVHVVLTQQFNITYGILYTMAEELEALDDVEFEGDPDLMIASRDFERIADARTNVSILC